MSDEPAPLGFEEAVQRLEAIVAALEGGELPLEECLRQFEEAVALSRRCAACLEAAERQIQVLTDDGLLPAAEVAPWAAELSEGARAPRQVTTPSAAPPPAARPAEPGPAP